MEFRTVAILGLGLMGGSLGYALSRLSKPPHIVGFAHRPEVRARARKLGIVDEIHDSPEAAVRGADLVIMCTPVGIFESLIKACADNLSDGCVVTDVGSTKRSVVAMGERLLTGSSCFVGSHPMAGSEKRGLDFARPDLYENALVIVTPTAQTNPTSLARVEAFWTSLTCRIHRVDPVEHDRLLAYVSHLPHLLAASLVSVQPEGSVALAAGGFGDMTRIASGDAVVWRDIFLDNRDMLKASVEKLKKDLDNVTAALDAGDSDRVLKYLAGVAGRKSTYPSFRPPII